ncbi:MAG TPA: 2-oxo acid dehydrogenase subunit E2 [Terriglobia bacterium]|nr:2-oxo acid dehydrogenase subunit E2 [Terriglobia bacterium]
MANEIKLPALGENVDSGTVVKVLISRGDKITKDQPVLELETDKASVEVPASESGVVEEIRVHEGDTIHVGQVLFTLDGHEPAERRTPQQTPQPGEPKAPETPPPSTTTPAPQKSEVSPVPTAPGPPMQPERSERVEPAQERITAHAAPSTRLLARELGVEIEAVTGTGSDGRISEDDVRNYARSVILNATSLNVTQHRAPTEPEKPQTDFSRWGAVEERSLTPIRRRIASHVHEAWTTIPHVTHFESADVTELEELRKKFAPQVAAAGGKLSVTAIALKIAAVALKVFPDVNASLDTEAGKIVYKRYYHIGIAVDTEAGLLVPVIRDVDKKGIRDLSIELNQVAEKARHGKLSPQDMQGGTFTITNLGGIGGVGFTPIVNSPEAAILGLSRAAIQPIFRDGEFVPRLMLPLALSYDHRLIDGAGAARFLAWIREAFESPFMLALEG